MSKKIVLAANLWPDNSYLIEDVARLGYLHKDALTLDPTYGNGVWWKRWRPRQLFDHDLDIDGYDFRDLPYDDDTFDAIAFDPPFVSTGGRETTKIAEFYARYGLSGAPTTPELLQELINDGLDEMYRLVRKPTRGKKGGIVLCKTMDYVSSGKVFPGTYNTFNYATNNGFVMQDRFLFISKGARQQPKRSRKDGKKSKQQHARNNFSVLFAFRAT